MNPQTLFKGEAVALTLCCIFFVLCLIVALVEVAWWIGLLAAEAHDCWDGMFHGVQVW